MNYKLKLICSCIFEFFTCRKKPQNNEDDLIEYYKIYDSNSNK